MWDWVSVRHTQIHKSHEHTLEAAVIPRMSSESSPPSLAFYCWLTESGMLQTMPPASFCHYNYSYLPAVCVCVS